jgi:hypothetical protein
MHFFDAVGLALRLKDNQVPSREHFYYFLLGVITSSVFYTNFFVHQTSNAYPAELNIYDYAADLINIISLYGMFLSYKTNRKGDDLNFTDRFICLLIPISVQAFFFALCATLSIALAWLFLPIFSLHSDEKMTIIPTLYLFFFMLYI